MNDLAELIRPGVIACKTWPGLIKRKNLKIELTPREFDFDFIKRFEYAENLKIEMRRKYASGPRIPNEPFDKMLSRAIAFWSEYQAINDLYCPEDPVYSKVIAGVAASTTNDSWELGAAASGQSRVLEHFMGGEATTSAVIRISVRRVTSQGTGTTPTAYTPEKFSTRSPAAAGTYYGALAANVTWGTAQATLGTNNIITHATNAFGGTDRWVAQPGEEAYVVNAEFVSLRSDSGVSVITAYAVVEEL